jgi:hypothetical protein
MAKRDTSAIPNDSIANSPSHQLIRPRRKPAVRALSGLSATRTKPWLGMKSRLASWQPCSDWQVAGHRPAEICASAVIRPCAKESVPKGVGFGKSRAEPLPTLKNYFWACVIKRATSDTIFVKKMYLSLFSENWTELPLAKPYFAPSTRLREFNGRFSRSVVFTKGMYFLFAR